MRVRVVLDDWEVRHMIREAIRTKHTAVVAEVSEVKVLLHPIRWRRKRPRSCPIKEVYVDVNT